MQDEDSQDDEFDEDKLHDNSRPSISKPFTRLQAKQQGTTRMVKKASPSICNPKSKSTSNNMVDRDSWMYASLTEANLARHTMMSMQREY